ncbi:polysaccharide deacetylase family protein [Pseudarthrobacter siccitolerans]|uniref:Polysaccharide deacetylase family protein n=1 Tax=Pseudarthrobacter siccitolerans TaxID=861266 RepID=A0A024H0M7_9MICC|nr:polysaccharide deacetylase family protein [Pseudarthrobacter siccitolerans]CCQ45412.1 polysaccharide deacetylase family protein [Pseudarthrobacter siccitolerans]
MGAASWRKPGASGPFQGPPFRGRRGNDVEPVPIKRLAALPVAFTLLLGGASLAAVPAAHAADGAMISVTLDDGWRSQHTNALPILNKYGVPTTMYIHADAVDVTPTYMSQAEIRAFADRGDQIASHTVTHTDLTTLTPAQLDTELAQSQIRLRQMFGQTAAEDFASPFGAYNDTTTAAVKKYYSSQRNTDEGTNSPGADPYNILVRNVVDTTTADTVQGWITEAKTTDTWLVLVYHEVGANLGNSVYHLDTPVFDAHMAAVKNSGLPMVTVRQALSGSTPPPPDPNAGATAAINAVAAANPTLVGTPTGDMVCGLLSGGCYRNYTGGAVIWSPATGAHYSVQPIRQAWARTDYERGRLGYPTTDHIGGLVRGGMYQSYQGGAIIWSPASGAHYSAGVIRQVWAGTDYERGGLGYPTTDEIGGLVRGGVYQMYQGGAIIWSPASGAHYSFGAIRQVWAGTDYERGGLGYPTTNEIGGLVRGGVYQMYQGGAIIWSPASGAHYSFGAIRQAWAATDYERGRLGYPTSGEYLSGAGVAQNYEGGRINWTASGGAVVTYK